MGCFAAVGAVRVACESPEDFVRAARELAGGQAPALVVVDDRFAGQRAAIERLRTRGGAAVILLPATAPEGHPGLDEMRAIIEQAAGANILGEY